MTHSRSLSLLKRHEAVQTRVEDGSILPYYGYLISKVADPQEQLRVVDAVAGRDVLLGEVVGRVRSALGKGAA